MTIEEIIEVIKTEDLEKIGKIWNYFDCSVYYPDHPHPYKNLGIVVCRGKIMKKAHNCLAFKGHKMFGYYILNRNKSLALSINYENFELSFIIFYDYTDENTIKKYFQIDYNKEKGKLEIVNVYKQS